MSRSEYQAVALLAASAGVLKLLEPESGELRPTVAWTLEQVELAVQRWPVRRDGKPLVRWIRPRLEALQEAIPEDVPVTVAVQLTEQLLGDLAGRLRSPRKLELLDGALAGIRGLSDAVDPDGDYETCLRATRLSEPFYRACEFEP